MRLALAVSLLIVSCWALQQDASRDRVASSNSFLRLLRLLNEQKMEKTFEETRETPASKEQAKRQQDTTFNVMVRQLMLQQQFLEERIRSDGSSGVKQTRIKDSGSKLYHVNTATGTSVASIHDHANNIRTVGMGEFVAVLNGVEFRTRHNDYRLNMASTTSSEYKSVEDIPFPDVPPQVMAQPNVDAQIGEMREWFRAWKDQDYSVRDYRPYFKPVLCYLEGTWTHAADSIEESFDSDRHFLDAASWFDLHEKIRYTSYSGRKSQLENYAFLPSTIMNMGSDGTPELAQWNYRILCHPLQQDVPLANFRVVDDLATRANHRRTLTTHSFSRAARFQLDPRGEQWAKGEHDTIHGYLDELMMEVPGMNNYPADLKDDAMGNAAKRYDGSELNAGYYHRVYRMSGKDAMGESTARRAVSDDAVFFAMNNHTQVAGPKVEFCKRHNCYIANQKWSYAIPLEIIYLTPLYNWNPYNLEYKGDYNSDLGKTVMADGTRNGEPDLTKAYDGINSKIFYQTPSSFFTDAAETGSNADTAKGEVAVLSQDGSTFHRVRASGTRIALPTIDSVGSLRARYPIMSMHHEGSAIMKELQAVKDMVSERTSYAFLYQELPSSGGPIIEDASDVTFSMGYSRNNTFTTYHTHRVIVSQSEMVGIMQNSGSTLTKFTDTFEGHNHVLLIEYEAAKRRFRIKSCDGRPPNDWGNANCADGHNWQLNMETEEA